MTLRARWWEPCLSKPRVLGATFVSSQRSLSNPLQPAHVGTQRFRDDDAAVFLLIVLQHRDERSPDRESGAVECVNKDGFALGLLAIANLGATRLKILKIRTGTNLSISGLTRQPHFKVIGLRRREAQITGAKLDHAIG